VGSKWQIFVPTDLAYGQGGFGRIPPNSALIFEIELLGIGMPGTSPEGSEAPTPAPAAPITGG
jgi:FKBP-type peptidyl-prolyl cis-trans isomerase FklB